MLCQIFANAARNNWFQGGQKPLGERVATTGQQQKEWESVETYVKLRCKEFPGFLQVFNANDCGDKFFTRRALVMLLTLGFCVLLWQAWICLRWTSKKGCGGLDLIQESIVLTNNCIQLL